MKYRNKLIAALILLLLFAVSIFASEPAPEKVKSFANSLVTKYSSDAIIVEAVLAENAKGKSLDDIKSHDELWKSTAGVADFMQALIDSECGQYLKSMQNEHAYFAEIFVMDNQGANVAMTDKTSDYWQGDEAKFQESYKSGKGGIHISDVEFDESSQAYLVQVSIPVKDTASGKVIGAVTFGIDVDQL